MRELVIAKIVQYTSMGQYLEEDYGVVPDHLQNMSDERLLELLEDIVVDIRC